MSRSAGRERGKVEVLVKRGEESPKGVGSEEAREGGAEGCSFSIRISDHYHTTTTLSPLEYSPYITTVLDFSFSALMAFFFGLDL